MMSEHTCPLKELSIDEALLSKGSTGTLLMGSGIGVCTTSGESAMTALGGDLSPHPTSRSKGMEAINAVLFIAVS
ncbi:enolase N-terminal-like fold-containing protein [Comamonas koreensis]|uniref:enolase N-terminal-like fold-containing protein n=1 Tax=Comamonas koreensis TaxID=160825 RepID=UPI0038B2C84D